MGLTNTGQNVTISIIFKKSLFIIKYTFSQFQNDNDVRHEFSDLKEQSTALSFIGQKIFQTICHKNLSKNLTNFFPQKYRAFRSELEFLRQSSESLKMTFRAQIEISY